MEQPVLPPSVGRLRQCAEAAIQPAIRIQALPVSAPLSPYASKFGGRPFTPEGFVWPVNPSGRPMHFIGQIHFAEVIAQAPSFADRLPGQGLFQFFYASEEELSAGIGVGDQRYARFFWYPDPQALQSVLFEPVTSCLEREFRLEFHDGLSLPGPYALRDKGSREEIAAYLSWGERERPRHQLLGQPWGIQYDPRESAQRGNPPESGCLWLFRGRKGRERALAEYRRRLDEWQLLWQIDSDASVGFEWIDDGLLYILVRREALQQRDLSKPWLDLQCF